MTVQQLLEKTKSQKIGKTPVIVLPLKDWRKIEMVLEEYQTSHSLNYLQSIKESRKQIALGKLYEFNLKTGAFKKSAKLK
ncbi:MAG: hypothetical protein HYW34_00985 [Candidatus Brennerbacteria bacterium]|nr:hypothetical protein [Candidatus Brennerbacteria bacterium]